MTCLFGPKIFLGKNQINIGEKCNSASLHDCLFLKCTSDCEAVVVFRQSDEKKRISISKCTFNSCYSQENGAIKVEVSELASIQSTCFTNNSAPGWLTGQISLHMHDGAIGLIHVSITLGHSNDPTRNSTRSIDFVDGSQTVTQCNYSLNKDLSENSYQHWCYYSKSTDLFCIFSNQTNCPMVVFLGRYYLVRGEHEIQKAIFTFNHANSIIEMNSDIVTITKCYFRNEVNSLLIDGVSELTMSTNDPCPNGFIFIKGKPLNEGETTQFKTTFELEKAGCPLIKDMITMKPRFKLDYFYISEMLLTE